MATEVAQQVLSCGELSVGEEVEAWHNGKVFHRGHVIRTVAATDLFCILDGRTKTRRLIDAEALVIRRAAVPAARPDSGDSGGSGGFGSVVSAPGPAPRVPPVQDPSRAG